MTFPTRKHVAVDFLTLVAHNQVREAFARYIGPGFKHHNPHFHGDGPALMAAMEENAKGKPNKVLEVQFALEDGPMTMVFSKLIPSPDATPRATVHIFRFDGLRIVELWDIGMPAPEHSLNEHGVF